MSTTTLATAEELLQLPRGLWRYELLKGEVHQMSPAGHRHGKIAARLTAKLQDFVEDNALGEVYAAETGFLIGSDPDTVRAPDAAFVRAERFHQLVIAPEGFFPGAPDLAFEVVSPSDSYSDVEAKVAEWLRAGCQVVVVLDPRRRAAAVYGQGSTLRLTADQVLTLPELLPGWSLALAKVFR